MKNPLHTDRCQHRSVYHNNGLWQLEINRLADIYNSCAKICRSVIIQRTKYQSFEKVCM